MLRPFCRCRASGRLPSLSESEMDVREAVLEEHEEEEVETSYSSAGEGGGACLKPATVQT